MSVYVTDDVSIWGYAYDTGGSGSPVEGYPQVKADPTREYVAGGDGFTASGLDPLALPATIDDITRTHGFRAYEAMLTHPACFASGQTLRLGIMAGDFTLVETHPAKFYQKKSLTADQNKSKEIKDFCQHLIDGVEGFRQSLMQMYECPLMGVKLGEMTARVVEDGEYKGKLVLDTFNVKKWNTWQFIVNKSLSVTGILAKTDLGTYKRIKPDKFLWFTWMAKDNDPRGRSILRAAYSSWNLWVQLYPQYFKALKQFAVPSLVGITHPDAEPALVNGAMVTAEELIVQKLIQFQNGSALGLPYGSSVIPVFVQGNGSSFLEAFNFLNQEIVYAMLLTTRATREAEHGSKADAQQGGDIFNLLVEYGRELGSEVLRNRLLKMFVRINYGKEIADKFTPYVYFGQGEPQDFVARVNAYANVKKVPGAITPSMDPALRTKCGLPEADPEIDEAMAAEQPGQPTEPGAKGDVEAEDENNPDSESDDEGSLEPVGATGRAGR